MENSKLLRDNGKYELRIASYGRGPCVVTSGLHFVVLRLGAGRAANGRVGEVHMRRHRCRVRGASGFRVSEVVG